MNTTINESVLSILAKPMDKTGKISAAVQSFQDSGIELQDYDLSVLSAYALHDILTGMNAKNFKQYLAEKTIFARMFGQKTEAVHAPDFQDSQSLLKAMVSKAPAEKLLQIALELDKKGELGNLLLPDQITRIDQARQKEIELQESLQILTGLTGLEWRIQNALKKVFYVQVLDKAMAHKTLVALRMHFAQEDLNIRLSELATDRPQAGMRIEKEKSKDEFGDMVESFKSASFYCHL
jgi:hypothetical protein